MVVLPYLVPGRLVLGTHGSVFHSSSIPPNCRRTRRVVHAASDLFVLTMYSLRVVSRFRNVPV